MRRFVLVVFFLGFASVLATTSEAQLLGSCRSTMSPQSPLPDGTLGVAYKTVQFTQSVPGVYTYSASKELAAIGLDLSSLGAVSGTPSSTGKFAFQITATQVGICSDTYDYSISIVEPACSLTISPRELPAATVGVAYIERFSGGTSYSISGEVPDGLLLKENALTGTPVREGKYAFTISATDSKGCSGSQSYSFVVCPAISITAPLTAGVVGAPYRNGFTADRGTAPYEFTATGLIAPGLTLALDGTLSGTPSAEGSFSATVTARDNNGCLASTTFTMTVKCPTITVGPSTLTTATAGSEYKVTLTADGTAPHKFSHTGGSLPPGLTLADDGTLSGIPSDPGDYTFGVSATDANGCRGSAEYSLSVGKAACPAITVGPATLSNGTVAIAYKATVTASGGKEPYQYTLSSGVLPGGLALSGDTIAGTPTTTGTFEFTITASDANGCSGSAAYKIEIAPPACPAITVGPATLPGGTTGTSYRAVLLASGGAAPYVFAIAAGSLPGGLALSGDTIAGTPTTAGSFKFAVSAKDANGCVGSASYTIDIASVCSTGIASPAAPASGSEVDGSKPIAFSWKGAENAMNYDVLVSKDGTTFSVAASTTGTSASASLTAGSYLWTVRTNFGGECKPTVSEAFKLSVTAGLNCPTPQVGLVSPKNGATDVDRSVIFEWLPVTGATDYALLLSVNGASATKVATTTETKLKFEVPEGTIGWAILATLKDCPATVSETFFFKTKPASTCPVNPPRPALIAPSNNAVNVASPVRFSWNPVTGAKEYRLYTWHDGKAAGPFTTTLTSYEMKFAAGAIVWLIEAVFPECTTTVLSDKWTFTVLTGSVCETTAPVLRAPADGASSVLSPVTFSWDPVPNAVAYQLWFGIGTDRLVEALTTKTNTHTQSISTTGRVLWQVVALFSGCDAVPSPIWSFTLVAPTKCPEGTITLRSPENGSTVSSRVTFSWTEIAGVTEYRVLYSVNGATSIIKSSTTSATASIEKGAVKWVVEALVDSGCKPIVSAAAGFNVEAASSCEGNTPPVLESPVGSPADPVEFTANVQLRWAAAPGATSYRVWLSADGKPAEDFETTATSADRELPAGSYAWFVTAQFAGCSPLPSATGYFRIRDLRPRCGDENPSIISPVPGATGVSSSVTFLWSKVAQATGYRVYALLPDAAGKAADFKLLSETSDTSLSRTLPPGEVFWFVEAVLAGCPSTVSTRASFRIAEVTNCADDFPQPISPRDGAENVQSPVELSWNPVSRAVEYVVVARSSEGEATPIGRTKAETSLTKHMPAGATIEWYVIALRDGCKVVKSGTSKFTVVAPPACDSPAPQVKSPRPGSVVSNPVHLSWTAAAGASRYRVWILINDHPSLVATPSGPETVATMPEGQVEWYVEAEFDQCLPLRSATSVINVVPPAQSCDRPPQPQITVIGQALSNTPYTVEWSMLPSNVKIYELQESGSPGDFTQAASFVVEGQPRREFTYSATVPIQKFYRVRAVSGCSDEKGPYSDVVGVHVVPINTFEKKIPGTAEIGVQQTVIQTVFVPGGNEPLSFTARTDQPWIEVSPSSGILPPEGLTFTLSADPRTIGLGANMATLVLTYGAGAHVATKNGGPPTNVPVSISLVTPVGTSGKNTPLADSLIIPAVGHAPGANNSLFQSDVRVANTSTQPMTYQLNFTPSGADGTLTGNSTTIQVAPGATVALNDVLASFFGTGPTGAAIGVLEIRPLSTTTTSSAATSSLASPTIASSRTYNVTAGGTLGQYIPAIPFSKFVGKTTSSARPILSMQQIAESDAFRTNLGLVEGSGNPAQVLIRVFDAAGNLLGEMPEALRAFEHKQLNSVARLFGLQLDDGRIEVEVTSETGRVTAYASRQDNLTNDPLLVQPVLRDAVQSTRYVVPGVAYIDGIAKWRSDVRIFNAGSAATAATLTFFPEGNPGGAMSKEITIEDGQVLALDNILHGFFGINAAAAGGSLLVSTPAPSSIIATARTYADSEVGTYGLFAPGVTPEEAVGTGQRSLHLLQLEQSSAFRTNIGLVETTGKNATVEVSLILPGSKLTPKVTIPMPANGFVQFPLSAFNAGNGVYNARAVVKVLSGTGRVSAYGSVVDNSTNDSTYVPAQ